MGYTLQVLNDKEYDQLPYSRARKSLGCADPSKGLAFIRSTGVKGLDLMTMQHEIDHLIEKHNGEQCDEDGIYYKSGSNFFSGGGLGGILGDVAGVIAAPFTGGASLGFLPLLSTLGGAIQGGIQNGSGGILGGALKGAGFGGAAAGLGGGLLGGAEGLMGGASGGLGSALSGAGSGFMSGLGSGLNTFISGIPGFGAGGALNSATGLGGMSFGTGGTGTTAGGLLGSTGGSVGANTPAMSLIGGGTGNVSGQLLGSSSPLVAPAPLAPPPTNTPFSLSKLFNNNPSSLLGAGLMGASALTSTPQFQMPASVAALEKQLQSGQAATPIGQVSESTLQNIIQTPPSSLNPALAANDPYFASTFAQMDQDFANAKAQLDASFNASGQLGSAEYQDQLRQLTTSYQQAKDQTVAQENQTRYLAGQQEQMQAIQQGLGVDQNTMNDLVGVSGLDVQAAALKYGVDAQSIQQLRTILGTAGGTLLAAGLKK